jgi:hypothetical protein
MRDQRGGTVLFQAAGKHIGAVLAYSLVGVIFHPFVLLPDIWAGTGTHPFPLALVWPDGFVAVE